MSSTVVVIFGITSVVSNYNIVVSDVKVMSSTVVVIFGIASVVSNCNIRTELKLKIYSAHP